MKEPIRILHWGLLDGRGGIETFIMNLYRNIDRSKVQFDFLEKHDMGRFIYEEEIEQMGGRVFRVLYSQRENYRKSKKCLIDLLNQHPEIVGVHVHANFLYAKLLKDAKKAGVPIRILHSHNSSFIKKEKLINRIRDAIVKMQINKYASAYFACSELAAEFMFPNQKYVWIKNGIDTQKYDYNPELRKIIRKKLGIGEEVVIGFVGNFRAQKNPYFAIDVFEQFHKRNPSSKLLMIGGGGLERDIKNYVLSKNIDNDVIFLGVISNVFEMYQAMDAFLLPSLFEGLPVVLVEAQTSGLPCFVADNITRQIKITSQIKYLPLDISPKEWADVVNDTLDCYVRKSNRNEIIESGFDIATEALTVQNFYLSKVKV